MRTIPDYRAQGLSTGDHDLGAAMSQSPRSAGLPRLEPDQTGTRRFSEGVEQLPDTPEKRSVGRFSRGVEQTPDTPEKAAIGRFSHGVEQLPDTAEKRVHGRFSRGLERDF